MKLGDIVYGACLRLDREPVIRIGILREIKQTEECIEMKLTDKVFNHIASLRQEFVFPTFAKAKASIVRQLKETIKKTNELKENIDTINRLRG
jgi:hypothetical protein